MTHWTEDKIPEAYDANRIALKNPNAAQGVLEFASLCLVDNEINLLFHKSLSPDDAQRYHEAIVKGLKRYFPGFSDQLAWVRNEDTDMLIIHPPMVIDLDDVANIIGSVPELEAGEWIHSVLKGWKAENPDKIKPSLTPKGGDSVRHGTVQTPSGRLHKE